MILQLIFIFEIKVTLIRTHICNPPLKLLSKGSVSFINLETSTCQVPSLQVRSNHKKQLIWRYAIHTLLTEFKILWPMSYCQSDNTFPTNNTLSLFPLQMLKRDKIYQLHWFKSFQLRTTMSRLVSNHLYSFHFLLLRRKIHQVLSHEAPFSETDFRDDASLIIRVLNSSSLGTTVIAFTYIHNLH